MKWRRRRTDEDSPSPGRPSPRVVDPVDIPEGDPALAVFASASGPVDLDEIDLESPALERMREAGVQLVVPLVAQGELIGLLNLGHRLSEQPYSTDDRRLLASLASQAAPALRVAQLVREQEQEARQRERVEAELRVATLIQQNFLPRDVQAPTGWQIDAFYRPAREVGGDFYDVLDLPDGRVGLVVGDVTDKGVPAALVMASTRSVLRAAAQRIMDPGKVLERVNDQLVPDIPDAMFATCLYGVLDPTDGTFRFANAGHNLPSILVDGEVTEPRATGMPLGMLPGSSYEEVEVTIPPGGTVLLYSDALPEAHDSDGRMLGFAGVRDAVSSSDGQDLVGHLLRRLEAFTGPDWEQEDDLTFVVMQRSTGREHVSDDPGGGSVVLRIEAPSIPDTERQVAEQVVEAASAAGLPDDQRRRLETAVAEAVMNAMEHGNGFQEDVPVRVAVRRDPGALTVTVEDAGLAGAVPTDVDRPDLEAKIRGEQPTRGWGLFLAESMVDEVRTSHDPSGNTTELIVRLEEDDA
ncbi:MAG: SpoIIE family protein phosphatase [Nitriliruptorales bacterium]|nr:SpoIIE family protein phosphatase [Nitriliruptorales bacterium]